LKALMACGSLASQCIETPGSPACSKADGIANLQEDTALLQKVPQKSLKPTQQERVTGSSMVSAHALELLGADPEPEFKGCYHDRAWPRDLEEYIGKFDAKEAYEKCKAACKEKGTEYFGYQGDGYCFCGSDFGRHGEAHDCNCAKDSPNVGWWKNCVYEFKKAGTTTTTTLLNATFKGCYKDNNPRDLDIEMGKFKARKAYAGCNLACANSSYFGIEGDGVCRCGDYYGRYGKATGCNCEKEPLNVGWYKNCIYEYNHGPTTTTTTLLTAFLGCYADKGYPRDMDTPMGKFEPARMAYTKCNMACAGKKYFGLQGEGNCTCGDSYGKYGLATTHCNCGKQSDSFGWWVNCVYGYCFNGVCPTTTPTTTTAATTTTTTKTCPPGGPPGPPGPDGHDGRPGPPGPPGPPA